MGALYTVASPHAFRAAYSARRRALLIRRLSLPLQPEAAVAAVAAVAAAVAAGQDIEEDGAAARRLAERAVVPHSAVIVAAQSERLHLSLESRRPQYLRGLLDRHADHVGHVDLGRAGGDVHGHGLAVLVHRSGRGFLAGDRALRLLAVLVLLLLQADAICGGPLLGGLQVLPDEIRHRQALGDQ